MMAGTAGAPANGPRRCDSLDAHQRPLRWLWSATRVLGALSVLAVGAVHLQQYLWLYSAVPTIGMLFILNFVVGVVIGLALLSPLERAAGRRGPGLVVLIMLGGIALATVSFALLLVSEHVSLFGFREPGYDPPAIAASRGAEIAAVVFLGASLAARFALRTRPERPSLERTDAKPTEYLHEEITR
jgi:hypothetical protein